jgi:hypothetical protein
MCLRLREHSDIADLPFIKRSPQQQWAISTIIIPVGYQDFEVTTALPATSAIREDEK